MKLILTIAWRNILRHKGKSIIIGVILFLGALLMTIGNGIIVGMNRGIEKNIVNGFLGDIVLVSEKQKSDNILLDLMGTSVEPVTTYRQIKEVLQKQNYVEQFLPVGKNLAMSLSEDGFAPGFAFLLGVDFAEYQKMFPDNVKPIEGRLLNPGERGILVPTSAREELFEYSNVWIVPEGGKLIKEHVKKDILESTPNIVVDSNVVLMGMNEDNYSTDVRFTVKGVIKYNALNTIFGHFSITDIESYRECLGYLSNAEKAVAIAPEEKKLLSMEAVDLDSLFAANSLVVENTRKQESPSKQPVEQSIEAPLPDKEDGVYNLVFVKLKGNAARGTALKELNRVLLDAKTGVKAIPWNKAAGPVGSMAMIIKGALFVFVMILFFVAVIIIVNTLTMAALERTSEIGMMRAIGAKKSFISSMFLGETGILSAIFGGGGILFGIIIVKIIPMLKITSANDMVQILYGGDTFHPVLTVGDIGITIMQLALVTIVAAFYPMRVARSITPLDAITKD